MRGSILLFLVGGCSAQLAGSNGQDLSADAPSDLAGTPDDLASTLGDLGVARRDLSVAHANHDLGLVGGTACANPPCLNVSNGCPFPLWIHAANSTVTLMPDDVMLVAGSTHQYDLPASFSAARVNAFWVDPNGAAPDGNAYDKIELTFTGGVMNYNVTYVDYLALPARIQAVGPQCQMTNTFDPAVSCDAPVGTVLSGCPAGLLDGKRCLSAGIYCSDPTNQASALCHALDTPLASCETQNAATCGIAAQLGNGTPNVYSCSGYFDSQPANCSPPSTTCHTDGNKWCAALNRGMLAQPTSNDTSLFYTTMPYNVYARWVHQTCPNIYAFAYDDYPSSAGASGFRACTAPRLDITFCPGG